MRAFARWGGPMSNMKIVELIAANNAEVKSRYDAELTRAIGLVEDELNDVNNRIAELMDRVRRLEQGGGAPDTSA